ncbi:phage BR0599 family protein [Gilliamella apis]|uniref:Phage tail protein n=1 Tax=Gilliamella apis TaxID=1970738 RepID=A0A242NU21_9GAMM|nr:phage BR0599 family protein [Gilliamella apis]OTQ49348.1 phage tail protein [Gilliamella apis]
MSWNQFEYSTNNGKPLTLYEFVHNEQKYYRYTNADRDVEFNNVIWFSEAISNTGLSIGSGNNLEITLPSNNDVVRLFRGVPPTKPVVIRMYQLHESSNDFKVIWIGKIQEVKRESIEKAKLITASVASSFERNGLRLTYGRSCPYALYDHNCRIRQENYKTSNIEIMALDGANITVNLSGFNSGYFSGGYMEFYIDGIQELRGLKVHENNTIGILGGTQGLSKGMRINLYPGCDKTIRTCNEKFNNHLNYGGQPHIPGVSPFTIVKLF